MILRYPVQRHSTPPIASMTSDSFGAWFLSSRAVAATSIPGVHAPHCAAPCVRKDCCKRAPVGDCCNPSTVVISFPATCPTATRQAQTGSPSKRTVQAPQSPASHPTLVPVRFNSSRNTRESRCDGELDTTTLRPLTENAIVPVSTSACNSRVVAIRPPPRRHRVPVGPWSLRRRDGIQRWREHHRSERAVLDDQA